MKIPSYKRLNTEDFKQEEQELVEKLSSTLNIGIESLNQALNKRLNFVDNFESTQRTFSVKVDANGEPTSEIAFKLDTIGNAVPRASGSIVTNVKNLTNSSTYPTGGVFMTFTQSQNVITVQHLTGLVANNNYEVTVIVLH